MPVTTAPIHIANTFSFIAPTTITRLAPQFAPEAERTWAGKDWNPEFIYPQPAKDIQGAVFKIQHGPHTAVWINTLFDVQNGRMQYVYFIPEKLVTTIDVSLHAIDATHTTVDVTYARTALDPAANEDVKAMGDADSISVPKWKCQIETALGLDRKSSPGAAQTTSLPRPNPSHLHPRPSHLPASASLYGHPTSAL